MNENRYKQQKSSTILNQIFDGEMCQMTNQDLWVQQILAQRYGHKFFG